MLGLRIKQARKSRGLTQKQLASLCGWDGDGQARISNYEKDRRNPSVSDLKKIAETLGFELQSLIGGGATIEGDTMPVTIKMFDIQNGELLDIGSKTLSISSDIKFNAQTLVGFENNDPLMRGDFDFSKQVIIVDTSIAVASNNRYILVSNDGVVSFRKCIVSGKDVYIMPTSKGFNYIQTSKDCNVIGTAILAITEF